MVRNTQFLFRCEPNGLPTVDDFEIVDVKARHIEAAKVREADLLAAWRGAAPRASAAE